ncbi:MAG: CAP domain-containing protein [Methanobrevibacter sp.]|nr:CAP domain-containing protein [Methanobrevibacter sp.]
MASKDIFLKLIGFMLILFCLAIIPMVFVGEAVAASTSYEYQVLDLINNERSKVGAAPLEMDNELFSAAKTRTQEIKRKFSHIRPDGSQYFTVSSKVRAENIANGQKTPKSVMNSWMNSPMHRNNILNPRYKSIGIGYIGGNTPYWVQLFGDKKANDKDKSLNADKKPKTPSFSLARGVKEVTIKWNKVSDVSGYQIFRSTKLTGNYELKKTITSKNTVKCIDKNLKKIKYFYKIRSFSTVSGKREYSKFSTIKSITPK